MKVMGYFQNPRRWIISLATHSHNVRKPNTAETKFGDLISVGVTGDLKKNYNSG